MTSKAAIKLGREILDRFFREAEGKTENKIDMAFVLGDMDLTYDKAEEALEYLTSRGLVRLFGSEGALLLDGGVNAVLEDKDIGKLPKYQPEWPARGGPSGPAPGPSSAPAAGYAAQGAGYAAQGAGPQQQQAPQPVPPRAIQRPALPTLTCTDPEGNVSTIVLGWVCSIGRAAENTVPLNDRRASKRHAEVIFQGDHYALKDLGSANGTLLNNQYVDTRPLAHGDIILVGHSQLVYGCPHVLPRPAGPAPEGAEPPRAQPVVQVHAPQPSSPQVQAHHAPAAPSAQAGLHSSGPALHAHGMPATPSQLPRRNEHVAADDLAATALRPPEPAPSSRIGKPIDPPSARMDRMDPPSARMEPPSARMEPPSARMEPPSASMGGLDLDDAEPTIARPSPIAALRGEARTDQEDIDWPDEVSGTVDEGARLPAGVAPKPQPKGAGRAQKPPAGTAIRVVKGQPARPPPADDLLEPPRRAQEPDAFVTEPPVSRAADLFDAGVPARDLLGDTPAPVQAEPPLLDPALLAAADRDDHAPSRRADQEDLFDGLTGQGAHAEDDLFAGAKQKKEEEEEPLELEERAGEDLFPSQREPSFAGLAQPKPKREQLIASQLDQDLLPSAPPSAEEELFGTPAGRVQSWAPPAPSPSDALELEPIAPTRPLDEDEITSLARSSESMTASDDLLPPLDEPGAPEEPEPPPIELREIVPREVVPRSDTVSAPPGVIEEALRAPDPFDESTPVSPSQAAMPVASSQQDLASHAADLPEAPLSLDGFAPPPPASPMEEGDGATPVPAASRFEQTLGLLRQHVELASIDDRDRVIAAIDVLADHPLVKAFLAELPE